ncbi:MAG: OsmC family protein, partial [Calditrichota bacterium]
DRMGIALKSLRVKVAAHVDVRGTLRVTEEVPVGFQKMECHVRVRADKETDAGLVRRLLKAAEYSSVNLRTLQAGVPVDLRYNIR